MDKLKESMDQLRAALVALVQEEADTWAVEPAELAPHPIADAVEGFNEAFPGRHIDLETEVNWPGRRAPEGAAKRVAKMTPPKP